MFHRCLLLILPIPILCLPTIDTDILGDTAKTEKSSKRCLDFSLDANISFCACLRAVHVHWSSRFQTCARGTTDTLSSSGVGRPRIITACSDGNEALRWSQRHGQTCVHTCIHTYIYLYIVYFYKGDNKYIT